MAIAQEPRSIDLIHDRAASRGGSDAAYVPNAQDFEDQLRTYRGFLRWATIFVAHVAVILMLLAFFFLR